MSASDDMTVMTVMISMSDDMTVKVYDDSV